MPASPAGLKFVPHPQATVTPLADSSFITTSAPLRNPWSSLYRDNLHWSRCNPHKHWRNLLKKICSGARILSLRHEQARHSHTFPTSFTHLRVSGSRVPDLSFADRPRSPPLSPGCSPGS